MRARSEDIRTKQGKVLARLRWDTINSIISTNSIPIINNSSTNSIQGLV